MTYGGKSKDWAVYFACLNQLCMASEQPAATLCHAVWSQQHTSLCQTSSACFHHPDTQIEDHLCKSRRHCYCAEDTLMRGMWSMVCSWRLPLQNAHDAEQHEDWLCGGCDTACMYPVPSWLHCAGSCLPLQRNSPRACCGRLFPGASQAHLP